jgi:glycosyltransferase involved in cell wall biosynthesis
LILGQTHPVIRRNEGESYRRALEASIAANKARPINVKLVDKYLDFDELLSYLGATDIYLTPYLNPVQIVSGTLAYAVGCGKAIVSTPYLYAKELLAHGRGFLVPARDGSAIATTLVALLDDPALAREHRAARLPLRPPHDLAERGSGLRRRCFDRAAALGTQSALATPSLTMPQ